MSEENVQDVTEEEVTDTPEEETPEDDTEEAEESSETDYKALYEEEKASREKAEALIVKNKKKAKAEVPTASPAPQSADVQAEIMRVNGTSQELIDQLKTLAKTQNTDLVTAKDSPVGKAIVETYEKEQKQANASVGASKASGKVKPKKSFEQSNLSPEDHKAMWKKAVGK